MRMPRKAQQFFGGKDSHRMNWLTEGPLQDTEIKGLEPNFEKRIKALLTGLQKEKEMSTRALMTQKSG